MANVVPAPVAFPSNDEDWNDNDFDIPDGVSLLDQVRSARPSMTSRIDLDPEEDWDNDFSGPVVPHAKLSLPSKQNLSVDMDKEVDDEEDAGNASTIKVSKISLIRPAPSTATSSATITAAPTPPALPEDDFEDSFEMPSTLSHLSLQPATRQVVKQPSLDWDSTTTSASDSASGMSSLGFHSHRTFAHMNNTNYTSSSPSSFTSASNPSTSTDQSDDDDEEEMTGLLDGLVLPDSVNGSSLKRILESKKRGPILTGKVKVASPEDDENDFELGLVIGDDHELSPSRLLKAQTYPPPRSKSSSSKSAPVTAISSKRPPSRTRLNTIGPSTIPPTSNTASSSSLRARSPVPPRRKVTDSFPSIRTSPTRSRTLLSPPPTASSAALARARSPTPSAPGSLSRQQQPTTVSAVIKQRKSHSRLQPSTSSTASGSSVGSSASGRLARKASLSSLQDLSTRPNTLGQVHGMTPGSSNTISHAGRSRYDAPTASSRARQTRNVHSTFDGLDPSNSHDHYYLPTTASTSTSASISTLARQHQLGIVPPTRPSTPSSNPAALRLTLPTSASRTKARPALSGIFPSSSSTSAISSPASTMRSARSTSPLPPTPLTSSLYPRPPSRTHSTSSISKPSTLVATNTVKVLRRPKKLQTFGDGTELDGIEDLVIEKEKERKYRVTPSSSQKGGTITLKKDKEKDEGTIGRKSGASTANTATSRPAKRPGSSSSNYSATIDLSRYSSIRQKPPQLNATKAAPTSATSNAAATAAKQRRKPAGTKKKPTLIRNLSGAGQPKVVGDMKWNPVTLRWEGNDAVLRDFESHLSSSARPALITHFTGSSVSGTIPPNLATPMGTLSSLGSLASPTTGFLTPTTSLLASGARVVGNMLFDPQKMCWINQCPEEEEDVFAALEEENEEEEEKGGTLRAILHINASVSGASTSANSESESGMAMNSTLAASPARSFVHTRTRSASTSGSENESVPSIAGSSATGSVRHSIASSRFSSAEPEFDGDIIEDVDEKLVKACREAEERHRAEMKGWNLNLISSSSGPGSGRRDRARSVSLEMEQPTQRDRKHLFEIRALATRKYGS